MKSTQIPYPSGPNVGVASSTRRFRQQGAISLTIWDPVTSKFIPQHIVASSCYLAYYTVNDPTDISLGITFLGELDPMIYTGTEVAGTRFGMRMSDPFASSRTYAHPNAPLKQDIVNTFSSLDSKHIMDHDLPTNNAGTYYSLRAYAGIISNCFDEVTKINGTDTNTGGVFERYQVNCFGAIQERWYVFAPTYPNRLEGFFSILTFE